MIEADRARQRLTRLFDYSNELQRALSLEQIVRALTDAVRDTHALDSILDSVRVEATLPDHGRWNEAVSRGLTDRPSARVSPWPERLSSADEQAIANLTAMAVERVELLEEHASAQAVINSERVKTALLSSLSHDLRTPIAAISAMAGTLKSYSGVIEEASRAEMLETILEQCVRLDSFTGKLLSLGRLEAGLADRFELVDVEEVLGSVIAATRTAFADRRIVRRIAADPLLIMASPVLLEQVLFNVLENALGYSEAETEVQVMLDGASDMIAITVEDQGCGIAPADLPHIFDRFYRGSNGSGRSGHGLGLAITKAFLDLIGGHVEVISPAEDGKGTRVRILLPQATIEPKEDIHG
jgi:two-component system, OmpR family, sensor histidine kinase KdpD